MAIRRYFPWLLLLCYGVALVWPQRQLASFELSIPGWPSWAGAPRLPLLLLAAILFLAALNLDLSQLRDVLRKPGALVLALVAVWLAPVLLVLLVGKFLPHADLLAGPLLGLALVAAMPVANSSVAWTQQARGNLGWGLALVVLSIVLNPWITPQLLRFLGWTLSGGQAAKVDGLVTHFSGAVFIVWVLMPTSAGCLCRWILGSEKTRGIEPITLAVSSVCLLALNYANASLLHRPAPAVLAIALLLSILLSLVGLGSAWLVSKLARLDTPTRLALLFALSMKHNGLALALAGAMLQDQPNAILFIIVAILVQHAVAAMVDAWSIRSNTLLKEKINDAP